MGLFQKIKDAANVDYDFSIGGSSKPSIRNTTQDRAQQSSTGAPVIQGVPNIAIVLVVLATAGFFYFKPKKKRR